MNELSEIINKARKGTHDACQTCSRNPQSNNTAFASNCNEHFGVAKNGLIIILRDPGASDGGASHTAKLCPIENGDKTANILENIISSFQFSNKKIYLLNAIMHGFFDVNSKKNNEKERKNCKKILKDIINVLEPKVILALGLDAVHTSLEILNNENMKKPNLAEMIDKSFFYGKISDVNVFTMPHPAYAKINLAKKGGIE